MKFGLIEVCDPVGFPYEHGGAFQEVAVRTNNNFVTIVNLAWSGDIIAAHQTLG